MWVCVDSGLWDCDASKGILSAGLTITEAIGATDDASGRGACCLPTKEVWSCCLPARLLWLAACFPHKSTIPQLLQSKASAIVPLVMRGSTTVCRGGWPSPHQSIP
jgi:hypothetical protein